MREAPVPVESTSIEGLLVVRYPTHNDDRGFFRQTFVMSELEEALGRAVQFVQGNLSRSAPGVLRGIHAEPWDKLVYVSRGRAHAVIADLRPQSATFGHTESFELGDDSDGPSLFISDGLGHSYCVLGDEPADYVYSVTAEWRADVDRRDVVWDDPTLGIDWPIAAPLVSDADANAPTLRDRYPDHSLFA